MAAAAFVRVGDTVSVDGLTEVRGVVIQRVSERYVRVRWEDLTVPTTHLDTTLRKRLCASAILGACPTSLSSQDSGTAR